MLKKKYKNFVKPWLKLFYRLYHDQEWNTYLKNKDWFINFIFKQY